MAPLGSQSTSSRITVPSITRSFPARVAHEDRSVTNRRVGRASVAVMNQLTVADVTAPDGELQRTQHQFGVAAIRGLPAHDPVGERIPHRSSQNAPLTARDPGHIGHPQPVRPIEVKTRSTRSGAGATRESVCVEGMRHRFRRKTPCNPARESPAPPACGPPRCRGGPASYAPEKTRKCRRLRGLSADRQRRNRIRARSACAPRPVKEVPIQPDVLEVISSGSPARGTHKDPFHDVDAIIIYDPAGHPGWGQPGASDAEALNDTRQRVHDMLGVTSGMVEQLCDWRDGATTR